MPEKPLPTVQVIIAGPLGSGKPIISALIASVLTKAGFDVRGDADGAITVASIGAKHALKHPEECKGRKVVLGYAHMEEQDRLEHRLPKKMRQHAKLKASLRKLSNDARVSRMGV